MHSFARELLGVDLSKIPGLDNSILNFIAEIGTEMTKWKNKDHFSSWLNLVPNVKISGGKILSSKREKKKNVAGQILRQAACSVGRSQTALGDYYRKKRAKLGGKGAVVATAHKMAVIIYMMLLKKEAFNEDLILQSREKNRERQIKFYEQKLNKLKAS